MMTLRVVRSTSWAPSPSSSAATAPDSAGWLMPIAEAASRKCRCSATAANALSWETVGMRVLLITSSNQLIRV
jgi:hypothetical protein